MHPTTDKSLKIQTSTGPSIVHCPNRDIANASAIPEQGLFVPIQSIYDPAAQTLAMFARLTAAHARTQNTGTCKHVRCSIAYLIAPIQPCPHISTDYCICAVSACEPVIPCHSHIYFCFHWSSAPLHWISACRSRTP